MTPPLQPPQKYIAKLEEKTELNSKFIQFHFELVEPHTIKFEAGQYVSIKVSERGDRRSYSICSSPDIDHGFELLVDMEPGGLGCQYLSSLNFGDPVEILAPMGIFTVDEKLGEQELVFVATGSGITPFRAMIFDQLQRKGDNRPISLYWGLRHAEHLFWTEDFEQLERTFSNFSFIPTLSQPPDDWPLSRGRVTEIFSAKEVNSNNVGYYLCGNDHMIKDMQTLLQEKGVKPENIHFEKFY